MLSDKLIESALALTGRTMEDMYIELESEFDGYCFSIEKFCFYLISPSFIEKYPDSITQYLDDIGCAIWQYQKGNDEQLSELLTKIQG